MTSPFTFSASYILDKSHFEECFSESVSQPLILKNFTKSIVLSLVGLGFLLFSDQDPYAAWFIIALGILDALGIYYRKPWWVLRQLMSKEANSELTVTIDEEGLRNKSFYISSVILWSDVSAIEKTAKGLLIFHANGKNYLSDRVLSAEAISYLTNKAF